MQNLLPAKSGPKSSDEKDRLLYETEVAMLRGVHSAYQMTKVIKVSDYRVARKLMAKVQEKWARLDPVPLEAARNRLLIEASSDRLAAYQLHAEAKAAGDRSAAASSLSIALKASERQAKLLGIDSEKRVIEVGDDTLKALRDKRLAEIIEQSTAIPPLRAMYGDE